MSTARNLLLWASENKWMRRHVPKWKFVRSAVKKFMPGESVEDALKAAAGFKSSGIPVLLTHLGENINTLAEGASVQKDYLELIDQIEESGLDVEISLKLTQLGFDISYEETYKRFRTIALKVKDRLRNVIWIDMEGTGYTQRTIDFYARIKRECDNVGLCLQAYLYRTEKDIDGLLKINPVIRLVKGAYKEPKDQAYPDKADVDKNYLYLARKLLKMMEEKKIRIVFATHDEVLCAQILKIAKHYSVHKEYVEFHMLYGIKTGYQRELSSKGFKFRVLISYGSFWYPWYLRRLAERPANFWFVMKNIFRK